jgi:uncharacterized protein YgbK (DUF1537 family)
VQLAKKGARTEVMLSTSQKPSRRADVLVINTESRAVSAELAAKAVRRALAPWCETIAPPLVYKKLILPFVVTSGLKLWRRCKPAVVAWR